MEDKTFELLTKMYSEFSEFRTETSKKLSSMDSDIKGLKNEVRTIGNQVAKIENEHGAKLESLLDGYKQVYEGQQEIKNDIRDIKETINVHEVKLLKVK